MIVSVVAAWTFLAREDRWLFNGTRRRLYDSALVHAGLAYSAILFLSYARTFIYFRF